MATAPQEIRGPLRVAAPTSAVSQPAERYRRRRRKHGELRVALIFISPWIIGFLLFQFYPLLAAAYYSLTAYSLARSPIFVGFSNFKELFTNDGLFRLALEHSVIFAAVSVPLNLVVAFLIALLLNRNIRFRGLLRAIFFLPAIVPSVANAFLWAMMLRTTVGPVDGILGLLHLPDIDWLDTPQWALPVLILVNAWAIGPAIVIFLAGLQDVPRTLYEAARVDGARAHHMVRYVTLPMMSRSGLQLDNRDHRGVPGFHATLCHLQYRRQRWRRRRERRLDVLGAAVHGGLLSVRHRLRGRHGVGTDRYHLWAFSAGHPVLSEVHNQ